MVCFARAKRLTLISECISIHNNTFRLTVVTSLRGRLSSSEVRFFYMKNGRFEPPQGASGQRKVFISTGSLESALRTCY